MSHLRALANMGVDLNPAHLGEWPLKVGQYILNCGVIELLSYQHLNALEDTREAFNKNVDRSLSQRITRILTLAQQSSAISQTHKAELEALWSEARELSDLRNRIAHNPVLPTWKPSSDPKTQPPDLMGIPDMKQIKDGDVSDSISLDGLKRLIDATASLGRRLHSATSGLG